MWSQGCQSTSGITNHGAALSKKATLQILPSTVSQLLSASQVSKDGFAICDLELNQVAVVGVVRGFAPFATNIQYYVDDMTGPPLNVRQWVNSSEDCSHMSAASFGTYVKVTGSLRNFNGQRSLLATNIRCITDLNEITSHMLEVVWAHVQLFGKVFDVNMNATAASLYDKYGHSHGILPNNLSTIQSQVLHAIRTLSVHGDGISFHDLKTKLDYLSIRDIRTCLAFLQNEGHIFSTTDDHHFKSTQY
ncbi:replication protein A 32 kDa subunit-like [Mugil cephalus]|uniref:replication protein A 32 kDa subunit-like n=1 Tax=Mugil cephalus TaxID=48193 RepID=UPI001FB5984F|nr:replication protein A 32 kDa subunit-like [Mugil cephalus]